MDVRHWANQHPRATASCVSGCLLICVGAIAGESMSNRHHVVLTSPDHYYSTDDGKTFFAASGSNIAPFDYKGATAVRAYVFDCDGHDFVGYLERYTREARQIEMSGKSIPLDVQWFGRELKKPGVSEWTSSRNREMLGKIRDVVCPGGTNNTPKPVEPNP